MKFIFLNIFFGICWSQTLRISDTLTLKGTESSDGILSFKGIPFAKPPVGDLRFRLPEKLDFSKDLEGNSFDATRFGATCIQQSSSGFVKLLDTDDSSTSEDCLTVNVFTPKNASSSNTLLPVMVWIYGGSFSSGGSANYDGESILRDSKNFVFVSINYRVGVMGFLASKELLQENGLNLGILDQKMALEWVQDNIHFFGGDKARKLFQQAMLLSGPASIHLRLPAEGQATFDNITRTFGCDSNNALACLRNVDALKLRDAGNSAIYRITYDGKYANSQSLTSLLDTKQFSKIPILLHLNADEGSVFGLSITEPEQINPFIRMEKPYYSDDLLTKSTSLYLSNGMTAAKAASLFFAENSFLCMSRVMSQAYAESQQKIYVVRNKHINKITQVFTLFKDIGVYHTSELPHLFQKKSMVSYLFEKQYSLDLHRRYIDFVVKGDPGWKDYAASGGMRYDIENSVMEKDEEAEDVTIRCDFLISTTHDVVKSEQINAQMIESPVKSTSSATIAIAKISQYFIASLLVLFL